MNSAHPPIIRFQEGNTDSVDEKYNSELKDWQKQDDRAFPWMNTNEKKHHYDC